MARDDAEHKNRIRESILRHIRNHPLAADTAQGIVVHWLPATGFEYAPDLIGTVLDGLVAEQLLQAKTLPDGNVLYARGDPRGH